MQLQRLTGLEIEKLAKEYADLIEEIEGYEAILADEKVLLDIIREDIHEIKEKYGDKRRTQIVGKAEMLDDRGPDRRRGGDRHGQPRRLHQAHAASTPTAGRAAAAGASSARTPRKATSSSTCSSPRRTITC